MEYPLVSCIVPVFNGARYLRDALDSIFAQTYRPLEIIVADDGSTDNTTAVVASYGHRVRYLRQRNQGPAAARNLGIRTATGEFVAFLDADDLWHPDKLKRQLARFHARPELGYCVTYVQNFWAQELQAESERYQGHRISRPLPGYVTQTLLARRVLFERIGFFEPALRHGDGTEWFLRVARQNTEMELLPDVLTFRRLHAANQSRLLASDSRDEFLRIVKMSLDHRRSPKGAG